MFKSVRLSCDYRTHHRRDEGNIWGVGDIPCLDLGGGYMEVVCLIKIHWTVHLRSRTLKYTVILQWNISLFLAQSPPQRKQIIYPIFTMVSFKF